MLTGSPYVQYQYGYPHKTAYRALTPARRVDEVWAAEDKRHLSLYVHVPFCEMRCGFCNLFTQAAPVESAQVRFVEALERHARVVRAALGTASFSRVAFGGGTPTLLPPPLFARTLDVVERTFGAALARTPTSVETSPTTSTDEHLAELEARGTSRLSLGVQTFLEAEAMALARPQLRADVEAALDRIRARRFATLNVDLIYGIEGQTPESFVQSLEAAQRWAPEELYLYPLYVRPKTFLGKRAGAWDDFRLELYHVGRDWLRSHGYTQRSMRLFRRAAANVPEEPPYSCQDDGMVGLGVGARSYTRALHYAWEWAVSPGAVRGLIDTYAATTEDELGWARHGIALDLDEQRRRDVILSVLADGVDEQVYLGKYGRDVLSDFPLLREALDVGLLRRDGAVLRLTDLGRERSDALGVHLQSAAVTTRMRSYEVR